MGEWHLYLLAESSVMVLPYPICQGHILALAAAVNSSEVRMKESLVGRLMLIVVGVIVLVAVAPEAQGKGGTPITTCGQIVTTSAVLTQDLYCPSTGVPIGASQPGPGILGGASAI